uniref:Transcriptional regulator n=1 Tax=Loa loa TaxID=7209 RepID=A0A1I7W413_LOALO
MQELLTKKRTARQADLAKQISFSDLAIPRLSNSAYYTTTSEKPKLDIARTMGKTLKAMKHAKTGKD